MKKITFGIPEKEDFIRWFKILWFKLSGGFSCKRCGTKNNFRSMQFRSKVNDKGLIWHNHTMDICPVCTEKELDKHADIVYNNETCACDWCTDDEVKLTATFIKHDEMESFVTFGSNHWNGHNICQVCMSKGIANRGPIYSSHIKHDKGKEYERNELGMWIPN